MTAHLALKETKQKHHKSQTPILPSVALAMLQPTYPDQWTDQLAAAKAMHPTTSLPSVHSQLKLIYPPYDCTNEAHSDIQNGGLQSYFQLGTNNNG